MLAKTLIQTKTKHLLFHIPGVTIAGCHGSKTVGTLVEKFTSSGWKLTEYGFCLECSTPTQSGTTTVNSNPLTGHLECSYVHTARRYTGKHSRVSTVE